MLSLLRAETAFLCFSGSAPLPFRTFDFSFTLLRIATSAGPPNSPFERFRQTADDRPSA